MMEWLMASIIACYAINGGGGVTKQSGISQFWTDDYKVFDQIYGRTSDRELYGATVPPSISYPGDARFTNIEASEKKEKLNYDDEDTSAAGSQVDPGYNANYDTYTDQREQYPKSYSYDDFAAVMAKQQYLKTLEKEAVISTKAPFKFISYGDFKPISQSNDPDTYNYLKHLEALGKHQAIGFPQESARGLKLAGGYAASSPVYGVNSPQSPAYDVTNPENTDAYKSIQDILNAHEAKKSNSRQKYPVKGDVKYVNYATRSKKPNVVYVQNNDISKSSSRCSPGSSSCRKRGPPPPAPPRVRARKVLRKIKIINTDDD